MQIKLHSAVLHCSMDGKRIIFKQNNCFVFQPFLTCKVFNDCTSTCAHFEAFQKLLCDSLDAGFKNLSDLSEDVVCPWDKIRKQSQHSLTTDDKMLHTQSTAESLNMFGCSSRLIWPPFAATHSHIPLLFLLFTTGTRPKNLTTQF